MAPGRAPLLLGPEELPGVEQVLRIEGSLDRPHPLELFDRTRVMQVLPLEQADALLEKMTPEEDESLRTIFWTTMER